MFHAILSNFDFLTPPHFENFIGSQKFQNETKELPHFNKEMKL